MEEWDFLPDDESIEIMSATSKRQVLCRIAALAVARMPSVGENALGAMLIERERIGSTAIGSGVAIPQARCDNLHRIFTVLARLDRPVEFDAIDGNLVDLVCLVLSPKEERAAHLHALRNLARVMRDPDITRKLRTSSSRGEIAAVFQRLRAEVSTKPMAGSVPSPDDALSQPQPRLTAGSNRFGRVA